MNVKGLNNLGKFYLLFLVLGTFLLYYIDNQSIYLLGICLVPVKVPSLIDLGIVKNDNDSVVLPFRLAKLNNQNNDLTKKWYIEFWAWSYAENKLVRKRLSSINKYRSIVERNNYAYIAIKELNKYLESGACFDKMKLRKLKAIEEIKKVKEHINIIDYLNKALEINYNKYNGRTASDKKHDIKVFSDFVKFKKYESFSFDDFKKTNCIEFQKYLLNKGYSGKTINCRMSTISTFYNEAVKEEIILKNPFEGIDRIKEVNTGINKALNDEEIKRVKNVIQERFPGLWLSCMLMFYCFLRPNEIRQIKVKNVDLINKKIFVNSIVSKNKKSNKIDIPVPLIRELKNYLKDELLNDKYLISASDETSYKMCGRNTLRDKYNKCVKGLNLDSDTTFYSWKHTGVVKAYQAGIDIKALQIQGRWHTIDMMDKYLKSLGLIENKNFTDRMNNIEI
jgi:Site-specific recombinase XerD